MHWFLEGNRRFREQVFRRQPEVFQPLLHGQRPTALWIGCSDSRVPASTVLDAPAGQLFVHRNIGNLVPPGDPNLAAVLEYAVEHLQVPEVVVCGHSGCGAMTALSQGAAETHPPTPLSSWLQHAQAACTCVDAAGGYPAEQRLDAIIRANITLQLENLTTFPPVSEALARGTLRLHGVFYQLASGELELLRSVG